MDVSVAVNPHQQPSSPTKASRVLRSIMPKDYRRSDFPRSATTETNHNTQTVPLLPPDHPHGPSRAATDDARSGRLPLPENAAPPLSSHKRSKSSVSLRSLGRSKDGDREKEKKSRKEKQAQADGDEGRKKPKKTKSTTSLRALLTKNRSSKDLRVDDQAQVQAQQDKENFSPTHTSSPELVDTPIWSRFATAPNPPAADAPRQQPYQVDAEIARYTPQNYSPSKQRDFHAMGPPVLQRPTSSGRPKSGYLPSSTSFMDALTRKVSNDRAQLRSRGGDRPSSKGSSKAGAMGPPTAPAANANLNAAGRPTSLDINTVPRGMERPKSSRVETKTSPIDRPQYFRTNSENSARSHASLSRSSTDFSQQPFVDRSRQNVYDTMDRKTSTGSNNRDHNLTISKRGSRVMAAVAVFNGKAKEAVAVNEAPKLDPKAVDAAFEAVLDSRDIPENMRQKMRTLTLRVKADFVKQDRGAAAPTSPTKTTSKYSLWSTDDSDRASTVHESSQTAESVTSTDTKKSRSRSKTFTFSKNDSPTKRQKPERPTSIHVSRPSVTNLPLASPGLSSGGPISRGPQPADPEEFVAYLRRVCDPTEVEVGRLHKLRLLLRNETVAWVDRFISLGGMTEVVELLHRIMAVEWREEHEDQLLHEALLCLKGLCTTEVALARLEDMADSLFVSLIALLFDEEKKGPSEFNTRSIIINVLFAYLSAACHNSPTAMAQRARIVLGYLTGPKKPEETQPVHFVLEMRQARPYRVWCNEVNSVTREVFWIFLHHLNVIPLPKREGEQEVVNNTSSANGFDETANTARKDEKAPTSLAQSYTKRHFPGDRPPVPAAPYIGGVEWDATTYMTAHLDLLNGLVASLPSREERNKLRAELKTSGWEKVMGGTLRTCKDKFYCGVHSGLQSWIAAALEDGWDIDYVRYGPSPDEVAAMSPKKSPKKTEPPPRLESPIIGLPKLDLGFGSTTTKFSDGNDDGWLS